MRFIFTWIILFALITISYLTKSFSLWIPIVLYGIIVLVRVKEVIGNYWDNEKISKRDETLKLTQKSEEMAEKGFAQSGLRNQKENIIKENFVFERRKAKRKLWVDLVNTLFLK